MKKTDTMKTQAELAATGQRIREVLEAGLSSEWGLLERAYPLAHLFAAKKSDKMDIRDHDFESVADAYYGVVMSHWVEQYVQLHATLTARGHTSEAQMFEFANDAYVWACADREVVEDDEEAKRLRALIPGLADTEPSKFVVKAFVLETQSRSFLVVLNERYGCWRLHVRRFWRDIRQTRQSKGYFLLQELAERKDLTLEDVIKLAHRAADVYGDALPGVSYPERPLLSTFLEGTLLAGDKGAGIGLRYGDFRDRGYVVSFDNNEERPAVDKALMSDFYEVASVAYNIASAIDVLREDAQD